MGTSGNRRRGAGVSRSVGSLLPLRWPPWRVTLAQLQLMWGGAMMVPVIIFGLAWVYPTLGGVEGRFAGRIWPLPDGGLELGWLLAAAIVPRLVHQRLRRGLDPCERLVRLPEPGPGYRNVAPETLAADDAARPRYLPLYGLRLGLALLLLAPLLMPTEYWHYFTTWVIPANCPRRARRCRSWRSWRCRGWCWGFTARRDAPSSARPSADALPKPGVAGASDARKTVGDDGQRHPCARRLLAAEVAVQHRGGPEAVPRHWPRWAYLVSALANNLPDADMESTL